MVWFPQCMMYDMVCATVNNPYIRKEKNMNNYIFKKEPVTPVMAEHIKRISIRPLEVELSSPPEPDKVMATLRKDIYARVVDITNDAIVNAVIDFARSEGFTDVYLIDKAYIMAALENKQLQDELERDLEDAEERNNVKDALIDEQRKKIEEMRCEIEHLKKKSDYLADDNIRMRDKIAKLKDEFETCNRVRVQWYNGFTDVVEERNKLLNDIKDLNGQIEELRATLDEYQGCFGDDPRAAKERFMELDKECCELRRMDKSMKEELERHNRVCRDIDIKCEYLIKENKELTAANEDLNDRIKKMDKKLREPVDDNRDMVIENQTKYIRELEYKLRKYKIAGIFIKSSIAVAEDPEVPKYEKHS